MPGLLSGCGVSLSSFSLGGSSVGTSLAEEEATGSTGAGPTNVSVTRARPLDVYVAMGRRYQELLVQRHRSAAAEHVYRADVSPGGGKVTITVHQRADLGRAGLSTYVIDFKQQGSATVITTENRRMPPDLAAKMQYDIDRWQRGASDCNRKMPAVASAPAAAPPAKPTKQQPTR